MALNFPTLYLTGKNETGTVLHMGKGRKKNILEYKLLLYIVISRIKRWYISASLVENVIFTVVNNVFQTTFI